MNALEALCICAVDLFILITGYFLLDNQSRRIDKPIQLIFQLVVLNGLSYLIMIPLGIKTFSIRSLIGNFLPVNYFLVLYITLYWISPYINLVIYRLEKRQLKECLDQFNSLIGREYNGMSTIGVYGSQWGYSIVNFMLMYIIGAVIRQYEHVILEVNVWKYMLMLVGCTTLVTAWELIGEKIGFIGHNSALEYCNPFVITEAVMIFCLFKKMRFQRKIINFFAKQAFAVFILQNNFIRQWNVERAIQGSPFFYLGHLVLTGMVTYIVCTIIGYAFDFVAKPLFSKLQKIGDRHILRV